MSSNITVGSRVRLRDQDIWGVVDEIVGNHVIIEDEHSEYEYPDNRLEFHQDDVIEAEQYILQQQQRDQELKEYLAHINSLK
jgi:hypothetical protein